jgi:sarcosine oxidase subunit gamma
MVNLKNIPRAVALYGETADSTPAHENSRGAVIIRDMGLMDKVNFRASADNTKARATLRRAAGLDLPADCNTYNATGERSIIWLGPDEWLILSESGSSARIIADLDIPQAGHIAVVDVTDALGMLALKGPHARDVLAKHCPIDFHPSAFTRGMVAQSTMSHAAVTVICTGQDSFIIIGRSSFMRYLLDLIKDASLEYGFDFTPA